MRFFQDYCQQEPREILIEVQIAWLNWTLSIGRSFQTVSSRPILDRLKVDVYWSNMAIIWTPIFEWYVVRCGSEIGHQKGVMPFKEFGLHAQHMLTILGSKFKGPTRPFNEHKNGLDNEWDVLRLWAIKNKNNLQIHILPVPQKCKILITYKYLSGIKIRSTLVKTCLKKMSCACFRFVSLSYISFWCRKPHNGRTINLQGNPEPIWQGKGVRGLIRWLCGYCGCRTLPGCAGCGRRRLEFLSFLTSYYC